jgi:hypothetical protein
MRFKLHTQLHLYKYDRLVVTPAPRHSVEMYGGRGCKVPHVLISALNWDESPASHSDCLYSLTTVIGAAGLTAVLDMTVTTLLIIIKTVTTI